MDNPASGTVSVKTITEDGVTVTEPRLRLLLTDRQEELLVIPDGSSLTIARPKHKC